jgi:drug/metabolite transporter superfamily protein YnfA
MWFLEGILAAMLAMICTIISVAILDTSNTGTAVLAVAGSSGIYAVVSIVWAFVVYKTKLARRKNLVYIVPAILATIFGVVAALLSRS